jgi:hypothetical protein
MKTFSLIALLFLFGCSDKSKYWPNDYNSLNAAVIDGLFTYDRRIKSLVIQIVNEERKRNFDIKSAPVFQQAIKTVFNISDTSAIRELIVSSPSLDTTVKIATVNVKYENRIPDSTIKNRVLTDLTIIGFFLLLPTKDGKKCVVYYETRGGIEVAVLKKKNNKWYIASFQTEMLF